VSGDKLPPGWSAASIAELACDLRNALTIGPFGSNLRVADYRDEGVPLVFVRDIRSETFGGLGTKYVGVRKARELSSHSVSPGDLLITKMGDPPGDTALYPTHRPPAIITADCIKLTANRDLTTESFLLHWLRSPQMREAVLAESKGVAQQKVSLKRFRGIEVQVPPLNEQRRIVDKIDALMARSRRAKEALDAIPPLLERFRQSVLAAAFRGDLTADWRAQNPDVEPADQLLERIRTERRRRWEEDYLAKQRAKGKEPKNDKWKAKYKEPEPVDARDLPALPEGWRWASWNSMTSLITSGSRGWGRYYANDGAVFIRSQDINKDQLLLDTVAHVALRGTSEGTRTRLQRDDVLVTITGANVTRAAHVDADLEEAYVSQHVALARPIIPSLSVFTHLWLITMAGGRGILKRLAYGGGKPGLNLDNLRTLPIPVPPLAEAARLAESATAILARCGVIAATLRDCEHRTESLGAAILAKAFRGELVPQDPTDEPASALLERIRARRDTEAPKKKRGRSSRRP